MLDDNCGVYRIYCSANEKTYVGSSVNIRTRWNSHRSLLGRGVHENINLQRAHYMQLKEVKDGVTFRRQV